MIDSNFIRAFNFTCSDRIEGGLSMDPKDKGNWTGGEVGKGELHGTKWGVSAASYPHLDIATLSWAQVQKVYFDDYWHKAGCQLLPPAIAVALFDAAVHHGPKTAARLLQETLGVEADGIVGPQTAGAARSKDKADLIPEFLQHRLDFMRALKNWATYGKGWQRRIIRLAMECSR